MTRREAMYEEARGTASSGSRAADVRPIGRRWGREEKDESPSTHEGDDGPDAIVAWVESTGLRPFFAPLMSEERAAFLARYRAAVAGAYPPRASGGVLLPFPRLLIVASRRVETRDGD